MEKGQSALDNSVHDGMKTELFRKQTVYGLYMKKKKRNSNYLDSQSTNRLLIACKQRAIRVTANQTHTLTSGTSASHIL